MNRASFLGLLAAVPFVGHLFRKHEHVWRSIYNREPRFVHGMCKCGTEEVIMEVDAGCFGQYDNIAYSFESSGKPINKYVEQRSGITEGEFLWA
jgi:hypothetical protein